MNEESFTEETVTKTLQDEELAEVSEACESVETEEASDASSAEEETPEVDYAALIEADIASLKKEFSELETLSDITELENPLRYAELRDLGLSPAEAYLATRRRRVDNRSHLRSIHSVKSTHQNTMSDSEMAHARELFGDISDAEIRKLYKRVTK